MPATTVNICGTRATWPIAEWALTAYRRLSALDVRLTRTVSPVTRASSHKPPTCFRFRGKRRGKVDVVECPSLIQTRPLLGSARIALSIVVSRQFNRTLDPDCEAIFSLFKGNARWSRMSRGVARLDFGGQARLGMALDLRLSKLQRLRPA